MKRVLYLTNQEVPYRVSFFNGLAQQCDLTVMYEEISHGNRDAKWAGSVAHHFKSTTLPPPIVN